MLDKVLDKAGREAGTAVGSGAEGLAEDFFGLVFSPWGLLALVVVVVLVRALR